MKKIVSLLLLFAFFILFTACGAAQDAEIVPDYPEFDPEGQSVDMYGYQCVILQDNYANVEVTPFGYVTDSLYYDMIIERMKSIEKKFNCKLSFDGSRGVGTDLAGYVQRCFVGGLNVFNMVYCSSSNVNSSMAFSGYFYPLNELSEYIDLTDTAKYGGANLLECCMAKGIPYGVVPAALPQLLNKSCVLPVFIINEGLLSQYGYTDPRDLYEQKKWTWDALGQVTDEYFTKEGDSVIYSIASSDENYLLGFLSGCGMKIVFEQGNNLLVGYLAPPVINALDTARNFRTEHKDQLLFPSSPLTENLIEGKAFMTINISIDIATIARELEDFGIVPFAVNGTTTQNGEETRFFSAVDTLSIMGNVEEPEWDAMILSALLDPLEGYEEESAMKDFLFKTMFYDPRDVDVYMHLTDRSCFDYYAMGGYPVIANLTSNYKNNTGAAVVDSLRNEVRDVVEKYIAPNYYGYVKNALAAAES